jgi:hypothetical protein
LIVVPIAPTVSPIMTMAKPAPIIGAAGGAGCEHCRQGQNDPELHLIFLLRSGVLQTG